ncbi:MAG: aromatic acid exporter family protein [Gemmiger sp.]|nr:aromatic acid exporter family protein [Gemmiger sp.]
MKPYPLKIGGRIVKTVTAVFLCFLIDTIRTSGVPFYAAIAAILCIQRNPKDSFQQAENREIATVIGGLWGMGFLIFERYVYAIPVEFLRYAVLSLMLIPIIQSSLWLHQEKGTFLMCVVFLCIAVTHKGDENPVIFGLSRIADTTIGIVVALIVNTLPFKRQ